MRDGPGISRAGAGVGDRLGPRAEMILSSPPEKAPPQTNKMLVVSTCRNSCCGCLRPPCGGTPVPYHPGAGWAEWEDEIRRKRQEQQRLAAIHERQQREHEERQAMEERYAAWKVRRRQ